MASTMLEANGLINQFAQLATMSMACPKSMPAKLHFKPWMRAGQTTVEVAHRKGK